jgi:hypothetical protein
MKWLLLLAALPLCGQEMAVVPASFSVSRGERVTVAFQNAERDAVRDATLTTGATAYNVTSLRADGTSVLGEVNVKAEGTFIVFAGAHGRTSGKALLLSGKPGPAFGKRAGLPLEIVPEADPYTLSAGAILELRTLLNGRPASCQVSARKLDGPAVALQAAEGRVRMPLPGAGRYLVTAKSADGLATTLTFEVF